MANITDVARLAGVSHQTVSRVLNRGGTVRAATRERVEEAIRQLNYRPSSVARALATRKTRTIGLISTGNPLYGPSSTMLGFNEAARAAGYQVTIATMSTSDKASMLDAVEVLLRQNVEALVLIAADFTSIQAIEQARLDVPLILADSSGRSRFRSVSINQFAGARLATRHLIDLGHRRILHLTGPADSPDAAERLRGWRAEMAAHALSALEPVIGDWLPASGYQLGCRIADERVATAVFSANDQMALGLIHAFTSRGLRVPDDVSIVGFDDIPEAAHFTPPLSTVRQDFAELGARMLAVLLSVLSDADPGGSSWTEPRLIVRQSSAVPSRPQSLPN